MDRHNIKVIVGIVLALALVLLAAALLFLLPPLSGQAAPSLQLSLPMAISVGEVVESGLSQPLQVVGASDGSGRLFVAERGGLIKIVADGQTLSPSFLDLSGLVTTAGGEQGLLGLAFHPQYVNNGFFYVDYTRAEDGATVVARYQVSAADPNLADAASATTVFTVAQPFANHNGGHVVLGPDGYLYVGLGDGGGAGDPQENAQSVTTTLGKILRLDVDGGLPYAIPPDNPFASGAGAGEIWDYGLRNPWRFSFDRATGDLYIADVGQGQWEEIDVHTAGTPGGLNFGWDCKEGTHQYEFTSDCAGLDLVDPIAEYGHDVGRSVTGGFVYRGSDYPVLQGRYFYADFGSGRIWSMVKTGSSPAAWSTPRLELDTDLNISSFGEDETGELYVVDYGGGTIRRLASVWRFYLPLVLRAR